MAINAGGMLPISLLRTILTDTTLQFRKIPLNMGTKLDNELEFGMYDFAFHSIKTVLLHSGSEKSRNPKLAEACIGSARAAFAEVQHMRELCKESKLSIDGVISLGNW